MTFAVDWALKANYLYTPLHVLVASLLQSLFGTWGRKEGRKGDCNMYSGARVLLLLFAEPVGCGQREITPICIAVHAYSCCLLQSLSAVGKRDNSHLYSGARILLLLVAEPVGCGQREITPICVAVHAYSCCLLQSLSAVGKER